MAGGISKLKKILRECWIKVQRPSYIILPSIRRWLVFPHFVLALSGFLAVTIDRANLTSPLYEELFVVPEGIWAVLYLLGVFTALHAIFTASWRSYFLTNIVTLSFSLSYFIAILESRIRDGHEFSVIAFGIWLFPIVHTLVLAIIPTRVIYTGPDIEAEV